MLPYLNQLQKDTREKLNAKEDRMEIDKKVLNQFKTIIDVVENAKPENGYFWDDGKPDCLRIIDNTIEELENLLHNVLETNRS